MIIEATVEGGCTRPIIEDLNPGQGSTDIETVDPFKGF